MGGQTYDLGGEQYVKFKSSNPNPVITSLQLINPLDDASDLITPTSTLALVDTYTAPADAVLLGVTVTPVTGTDINYFIVINTGANPYFLPRRSKGSVAINLGAPFTWSWPYPLYPFLPRGSTISVYASSASGTSTMQIGYNVIQATGVN